MAEALNRILLLIRIALRDTPPEPGLWNELYSWSGADWAELFDLARKHSVTGLVCHALSILPTGDAPLPVPDELFFPLVSRMDGIERRNRAMTALSERLMVRLSEKGMHPQLLKGAVTARFYPRPELREFGDIDLYLPPDEFPVLKSEVGGGRTNPDGSFHFSEEGIDVDVHGSWLDLPYDVPGLPVYPCPEAILLQLSVHLLKHAVGVGAGLRQLMDLSAASRKLDYDPVVLRNHFERMHLGRWNRLASVCLEKYLDVPNRMYPGDDISPEPLMRIIIDGGNFGHHSLSRSRVLEKSPLRRKSDTALQFLRRMPFSLRYAPRLALSTFLSLMKGNLQRPR